MTKTTQLASGRARIQTRDCLVPGPVQFPLLSANCMQMGSEGRCVNTKEAELLQPLTPPRLCPAGAWPRVALGK